MDRVVRDAAAVDRVAPRAGPHVLEVIRLQGRTPVIFFEICRPRAPAALNTVVAYVRPPGQAA